MTISAFKNKTLNYFYLLCIPLFIASCDSTRYLAEGETFTRENRIILKSPEKIHKKSVLKEELSFLFKQNQNNNWIGTWFYYNMQDEADTLWYHNFARRFIAEEPSIFNETLASLTASDMQDFLRNKRGFYQAEVDYKLIKEGEFETGVDYEINCGKRYRINSIEFFSPDSTIHAILDGEKQNSFLIKGDPVSAFEYEKEKNRLHNLLQNKGYAQFYPNYIELSGDSTDFKVDLLVSVYDPPDSSKHKVFYAGDINVYTDYQPNQVFSTLAKDTIDGIIFHRELDDYFVHPELIASLIGMRRGELTSRNARQESYNRLTLLNPYKFIAIKQKIDTSDQRFINYDILLIPKPTKWRHDYGPHLNYTTLSESNKLFGVGLNLSMENQNLFGGAERFLLTFNADTDIGIIQIKPQEFYLQNSYNLFFPKPAKIHNFSLIRPAYALLNERHYEKFKSYSSTKLTILANYESLANTISIISVNGSLGYQYNPSENENLHFNQFSIDYYYPTIINDTLFEGNFFRNSLSRRVITGFLFKDLAYSYSDQSLFNRFSFQFNGGLDLSGHEVFLLNKAFNLIRGTDDEWVVDKDSDLKFAKYIKSYLEFRAQYKTGVNSKLASRIYMGLGVPFGDNNTLPWSRQFLVGGPQSIRAWEKRGLGPGAYYDPDRNPDEIAYQKGDIKLEANIEYRFDLPWYFEGATFIDAGNIWTFKDDINLYNENFTSNFYKQIAVGAGFGLRLNFNFLLLRLDLGYKLRTPYPDPLSNKYWQINKISPFRDGYLTFGLDYPF